MSILITGKSATEGSLQVVDGVDVVSWDGFGLTSGYSTSPVRQTVQRASVSQAGLPNALSAGTGLALNLAATASPMQVSFANGAYDSSSILSADVTGVATVAASAVSYVAVDYVSPIAGTWSTTMAPPQYGPAYLSNLQSVLNFKGTSGSTQITDDFGNQWTAVGGAKIQNTQLKFGAGALGGAGASNILNGSTDYLITNNITSLGSGSWSMRCWAYITSFTNASGLFGATNGLTGAGFGASLDTTATGNGIQLVLSSTGSSYDIANGVTGAIALSLNTWTFFELTFDAVAGRYLAYVNGVLIASVTSALKICPVARMTVGARFQAAAVYTNGYIDKFEFLPYCQHPNGVTYAVPTTMPDITVQGYSSDWFNTATMNMYQVTNPSQVPNTVPYMTAKNRVYVGEALAGAAAVTTVTNYAFNGYYDSGLFTVGASTAYARAHNIGTVLYTFDLTISDSLQGLNERPAMNCSGGAYGYYGGASTRNSSTVTTSGNPGLTIGYGVQATGYYRMRVKRSF